MRRGNKYGARRTEYLGEIYDSAAEARYAAELELQRRAGRIRRWVRGPRYVLVPGLTREQSITYKPDFVVLNLDGSEEAIDVKGFVPRDFRLRAILWAYRFPGIPLRVVNADGNVIWPKQNKRRQAA